MMMMMKIKCILKERNVILSFKSKILSRLTEWIRKSTIYVFISSLFHKIEVGSKFDKKVNDLSMIQICQKCFLNNLGGKILLNFFKVLILQNFGGKSNICTIAMIWLCVKRTSNVQKDRTLDREIRKTRNDFSVQVQTFLLPLSLKVLRDKEGEAQSFYSDSFICPPNTCGTRHKGVREQAKFNRLVRCPVLN